MKSARAGICAVLVLGLAIVTPTAATAARHVVNPGESIQAAVDAASAGDTIVVRPGDYTETHGGSAAVRITKRLKLIGKSNLPSVKVRILPGPGNIHGILVEPETPTDPDLERITIKGLTVEGFPKNGIWLRHVNKFKIQDNESIDNLENGIFPTLSANGLVKNNVAYGSDDAALWVEASENVRVIRNDLSGSPTGLEITVSKNILVKRNNIHDNVAGIGLYHPNGASLDPLGGDGFWKIVNNHVHDNNAVNNAPPGSLPASLPSGSGILLLGVDNITIKGNLIENNDFLGVAVVDWCVGVGLQGPSPIDCTSNPPIVEPAPDNNSIILNTFSGNGGAPPSGFEPFAADIVVLAGAGVNNCFHNNTPSASVFPPLPLPPCN